MSINTKAAISVIFGKRGSGKTTLASKLCVGKKRLIIYDSTGHDYNIGVVITEFKELVDYLSQVEDKNFRITYKPLHNEKAFEPFCELVKNLENFCLVIDEADLYASATGACPDAFLWLIKLGRHNGIELICISRRPPEISRNVTAQAENFYIFNSTEPRDIAYLKSIIGDDAEKIIMLDKYAYMLYTNNEVKVFGKVKETAEPVEENVGKERKDGDSNG